MTDQELTEEEIQQKQTEILALIREHFDVVQTDDGRYLKCRRCDMLVTWVTKHCAERHGDDVEIFALPGQFGEQLW